MLGGQRAGGPRRPGLVGAHRGHRRAGWPRPPCSRSSPRQLVGAIDPFIEQFDLTPFFVGVILIPTIGNLSEHLVAVQLALKDRVDFSMAVSIGSSLQVALFVAPVLVLLGLARRPADGPRVHAARDRRGGRRRRASRRCSRLDGESNWLEGALLLGVYAILAVSFFYLGS